MQQGKGISETALTWVLAAAMAAVVPVIYYLAVVGGWVPLLAIIILTVRNPRLDDLMAFNAVHCLLYGGLFYVIARWIAKRLARIEPRRRNRLAAAIVAALTILGFAPIYGIGHGHIDPKNVYQLYADYGRLR